MKKIINKVIQKDGYSVMLVKHKNIIIEVLIDDDDMGKVINVGSWHAVLDNTLATHSFYICHREKGKPCIRLHRFITDCPKNKEVDHINHNTLDNRKKNLKICTHFENQQNLSSKKSEQTGVYSRFRWNRHFWVANISKNGKKYSKNFSTREDAISWRKEMERKLYKEVV